MVGGGGGCSGGGGGGGSVSPRGGAGVGEGETSAAELAEETVEVAVEAAACSGGGGGVEEAAAALRERRDRVAAAAAAAGAQQLLELQAWRRVHVTNVGSYIQWHYRGSVYVAHSSCCATYWSPGLSLTCNLHKRSRTAGNADAPTRTGLTFRRHPNLGLRHPQPHRRHPGSSLRR